MAMDRTSFMDLGSLPPEVLSQIFFFLPADDRRNIRLVSRTWNECCNRPAILETEKFRFRSGRSTESIDLFLQDCVQLRPTIEFLDFRKKQFPCESTWQRIGEKIHSVSLNECKLSDETITNIFLYCRNMHTFKLSHRGLWAPEEPGIQDLFCSSETLDELIHVGVERRKVTSFQLFICERILSMNVFQKIFKIFPCIQNFGTGYSSYIDENYRSSEQRLATMQIGTLASIFDPACIKELSFNVPSTGAWVREFLNIPLLKLRKLETIIVGPDCVSADILTQFLHNQSELQILNVSLPRNPDGDYAKMVLFESLSICSKLVDFRLSCKSTDLKMKSEEFIQILRMVSVSKLECFMLVFELLYNHADICDNEAVLCASLPRLTNNTLSILSLVSPRRRPLPERYCLPILKHFNNLRSLELDVSTDKVMRTIFKYHVHLQKLVLHAFRFTSTDGRRHSQFQERKTYSISRLSKLRHLELEGDLPVFWLRNAIRDFNFPCLKHLRLWLHRLEEKIILKSLCAAIPSVEVLILDEVPLFEEKNQLRYFCKNLPRLRVLLNCRIRKDIIEREYTSRPFNKYVYVVDSANKDHLFSRF